MDMTAERSAALRQQFPDLQFGVLTDVVLDDGFAGRAAALEVADVITAERPRIEEAIAAFDAFFTSAGRRCPLPGQFASAVKKGLPPVPPLVRGLLYAEMTTGVLMGVQDGARVDGDLVLDLAADGETFPGMRGEVTCRAGEPVVRDATGIVASLFQGPDQRTRIEPDTRHPIFYVFGAPGLAAERFDGAVATVRALFPAGSVLSYG
jgi:DNA/RNA-binding domain of Phe-tRNA-synthetase-like protein